MHSGEEVNTFLDVFAEVLKGNGVFKECVPKWNLGTREIVHLFSRSRLTAIEFGEVCHGRERTVMD